MDLKKIDLLDSLLDFGLDDYRARLLSVKRFFSQYKYLVPASPARQYADRVLQTHKRICQDSKNAIWQLEHDVFIERFIQGKEIRTIAQAYNLTPRAVYYQLDHAAERILILLYGVDGIRQRPQEAVATGGDEEQAERE